MSDFKKFAKLVQKRYNEISKNEMFKVEDGRGIWDTYHASFPEGTDPLYLERTTHDCQCCRSFIRNIGAAVAIKDSKMLTVWDIEGAPYPYDVVAKVMSEKVKASKVTSIFRTKERQYGQETTRATEEGKLKIWNHFEGKVTSPHFTTSVGTEKGAYETTRHVFSRGVNELEMSAIDVILDMIASSDTALYKGRELVPALKAFKKLHTQYHALDDAKKDLFLWENANKKGARFRNSVLGTLISDLSDGKDFTKAILSYESKVAPHNFKRSSAPVSPKRAEKAWETIVDLGLRDSLERRHARISDISVNEVLFVDRASRSKMKDALLESLLKDTVKKSIKVTGAIPITMAEFLSDVVPKSVTMEVLVEQDHMNNFASITAPVVEDDVRMFMWNNDFSWSYTGNLADSSIKTRVKAAGGNVTAPFRVSLGWFNSDDLDIHVIEPSGNQIYYGNRSNKLDVDMNVGGSSVVRDAVENVCWKKPKDGQYAVMVKNYTKRENIDVGFQIEIENNGKIRTFARSKDVRNQEKVPCMKIRIKSGEITEIDPAPGMVEGTSSKEVWGVSTGQFTKVKSLIRSPNHWESDEEGPAHWFFVLEDCLNPDPVRGFYNENLRQDLHEYRKVFEILASKTLCPYSEDQLSGLGFSATQKASFMVKVRGDVNQTFEVTI